MPTRGTQKTRRIAMRLTEHQFGLLGQIREKNPEFDSNSAVIVAAVVRMARAEGVKVG